jgi:hypothetical protein
MISSSMSMKTVRAASGADLTKDYRAWAGSVFAMALRQLVHPCYHHATEQR